MTKRCYIICVIAFIVFVAFIVLLIRDANAVVHHVEKVYQNSTCKSLGGQEEVVTDSGTRCDCLTPTYAIEYDFAHKYAESIGQSINYAFHFDRKPGIVLIIEDQSDKHFLEELLWENDVAKLNITIWSVDQSMKLKQEN